jgi:hypothetical protein
MATAQKCAKTSPRTFVTKELADASRQRTVSQFFFSIREFLTKNNMTVVPHPPNFSLFPRLKIKKIKGRHFDTIRVTGRIADGEVRPHRTRFEGTF